MMFKNKINSLFALMMVFAALISFNACVTDDCENLDCGANSTDCVDGTCICKTGYFGSDCSVKCDSQHGTYNAITGKCECEAGYTGSDCSQLACPDCGEHGDCDTATATCECDYGWTGTTCDSFPVANYIGNYTQNDVCASGNYAADVTITTSTNANEFIISNFGGFQANVKAVANNDKFTIPSQIVTANDGSQYTIAGTTTAVFSHFAATNTNSFSIEYTVVSGNDDTCTATFTSK